MMTPGYAKPRSELPWLPYPESDRMYVINAHNFGSGAFSPAVNGKMPVAAWIPSRDTAGNGTTTLTDLVGSNNGTLTNMDAATDWVADTGAGGVRALDFDGSNDYVSFGSPAALRLNGLVTVQAWVNPRSTSRLGIAVYGSSSQLHFGLLWSFGSNSKFSFWSTGAGPVITASATSTLNAWHHVLAVRSASATDIYVDGTLAGSTGATTGNLASGGELVLGRFGSFSSYYSSSQTDDIRIWDQALDATDVADLYASGNGRGVDAS